MFRNIKRKFLLSTLVVILVGGIGNVEGQNVIPKDSLNFPWLNKDINAIQFFNKSALSRFLTKWSATNSKIITIAHLGDSHVQPDIYSGEFRRQLQALKGNAGRGMIFPYSVAKTYSANDYKSTYTGTWKCAKSIEYAPKLPLGVSGATCLTYDSHASFTISFHNPINESHKILKLFCKKTEKSFDFILKSGDQEALVIVDQHVSLGLPYVEIELPIIGNSITVQLVKKNSNETEFEFYGMSLESTKKDGVMLHCLGIGGAMYGSILAQKLFENQLPFLNPDLVIVDFGTNDYLYKDIIPDNLETQIKSVIRKIRFSAPNTDILLTSAQDMNRRGKNITSGEAFSDLIKKISREENCAFYDWFWISGGPRTMSLWNQNGLSQNDMIHLNAAGYKLKGHLLAEALLKTLTVLQAPQKGDSLVFFLDSLKSWAHKSDTIPPSIVELVPIKNINLIKSPTNKTGYKIILHTVKSGETLGGIAQRYHVSISSIMTLNNMKNSIIRTGKKLKIKVRSGK